MRRRSNASWVTARAKMNQPMRMRKGSEQEVRRVAPTQSRQDENGGLRRDPGTVPMRVAAAGPNCDPAARKRSDYPADWDERRARIR
jgi:hypothetical protein